MTLRMLLAVGCNDYTDQSSFGQLCGAEKDAKEVYETLLSAGDYDGQRSKLLISPTIADVHAALRSALFEAGPIDTLTVFFAGHGVLKKESFYLCVGDSRFDALSATALSLSGLLQMIAEAGPVQANVIIDACSSGGVAGDLNAILKHDVLGKDGSPSVTVVAAAASDQEAMETDAGGLATRAVLACIAGSQFVQNSSPNLDLIDIGRAVGAEVSKQGLQTPFVWGLNLFGEARFCKNPHHNAASDAALHQVAVGVHGAQADAIREALPKLYRLYDNARERVDLRDLHEIVCSIVDSDPSQILASATFIARLQSALRQQLKDHPDRFAAIEASAVCLLPLARLSGSSAIAASVTNRLLSELVTEVEAALADVAAAANADQFALLSKSGLADLYYLPLRLTKALGWAGAIFLTRQLLGENVASAKQLIQQLSGAIIRDYSTAYKAMSDVQAPYAAVTLAAFRDADLAEDGEALLSLLFHSVLRCGGRVARNDLQPPEVLEYLQARASDAWEDKHGLVSNPSELIAVLLAFAPSFSLSDAFDLEMRVLDHVSLNAFVPDQWEDFAKERISEGTNHTIQIGHHFFVVSDISTRLREVIPEPPQIPGVGAMAVLASLIFPDRTPWFLWAPAPESLAVAA